MTDVDVKTYSDDSCFGKDAPSIDSLEFVVGDKIAFAKNKVAVLFFWVSCDQGAWMINEELTQLSEKHPAVQYIAISNDADRAAVEEFLKKIEDGRVIDENTKKPCRLAVSHVAHDDKKAVGKAYADLSNTGLVHVPQAFIVDEDGKVAWRQNFTQSFTMSQSNFADQLERVLKGEALDMSNGPKPAVVDVVSGDTTALGRPSPALHLPDAAAASAPTAPRLDPTPPDGNTQRRVCCSFLTGMCANGLNCPFPHVTGTQRECSAKCGFHGVASSSTLNVEEEEVVVGMPGQAAACVDFLQVSDVFRPGGWRVRLHDDYDANPRIELQTAVRIALYGEGGCGKTWLTKWLSLCLSNADVSTEMTRWIDTLEESRATPPRSYPFALTLAKCAASNEASALWAVLLDTAPNDMPAKDSRRVDLMRRFLAEEVGPERDRAAVERLLEESYRQQSLVNEVAFLFGRSVLLHVIGQMTLRDQQHVLGLLDRHGHAQSRDGRGLRNRTVFIVHNLNSSAFTLQQLFPALCYDPTSNHLDLGRHSPYIDSLQSEFGMQVQWLEVRVANGKDSIVRVEIPVLFDAFSSGNIDGAAATGSTRLNSFHVFLPKASREDFCIVYIHAVLQYIAGRIKHCTGDRLAAMELLAQSINEAVSGYIEKPETRIEIRYSRDYRRIVAGVRTEEEGERIAKENEKWAQKLEEIESNEKRAVAYAKVQLGDRDAKYLQPLAAADAPVVKRIRLRLAGLELNPEVQWNAEHRTLTLKDKATQHVHHKHLIAIHAVVPGIDPGCVATITEELKWAAPKMDESSDAASADGSQPARGGGNVLFFQSKDPGTNDDMLRIELTVVYQAGIFPEGEVTCGSAKANDPRKLSFTAELASTVRVVDPGTRSLPNECPQGKFERHVVIHTDLRRRQVQKVPPKVHYAPDSGVLTLVMECNG